RKEQALRKCERVAENKLGPEKVVKIGLSPCSRTVGTIWDAKARIGRKAYRRPKQQRDKWGQECAKDANRLVRPGTGNCSTRIVGPEGRMGCGKPV
ncbi:hypothetical protein KI387_009748, partial [Taxus chinensis]